MKKKEEKGIDSRKSPPTLQEETHKIDKEGRAHTSVGIVPVRVLLSNDLRAESQPSIHEKKEKKKEDLTTSVSR